MNILRINVLLNVGFVIMIILVTILKWEIIVISLKNIEALHIETVISILKLNHKIPIAFQNLRNYNSHLIIQELGKFNLIPNGLKRYMSFTIHNKLMAHSKVQDNFWHLKAL